MNRCEAPTKNILPPKKVVILGAGCSGLSVAWGLADKKGFSFTILEASSAVGGLSRTIDLNGLRFDIGPHRLSPQLPGIVEKIRVLLGDDLLELKNEHGVYFNDILYSYPPKLRDMFHLTSLKYTSLFGAGWLAARIKNIIRKFSGRTVEPAFENTILNAFGKAFSEAVAFPMIRKVWGTQDLHHDFARIRFELPTFSKMLSRFIFRNRASGWGLFYYPAHGFGRIPDAIRDYITGKGQSIELNAHIRRIGPGSLQGPFSITYDKDGQDRTLEADLVVSTISNSDLIRYMAPSGLVTPLVPAIPSFTSRTMWLGVLIVKNYRLPARVIIFPEEKFIFNRISALDRFS